MYGQIIKYNTRLGFGVIQSDDGDRFRFAKSAIQNPNGKLVGYGADFLLDTRQPKEIVLMQGTPWTAFASSNKR